MKCLFLSMIMCIGLTGFSQIDTSFIAKIKSLDTADMLKLDTTKVPDDILTRKIKLLRSEKHGMNVETVVKIKISEEQQKDITRPKEFYTKLLAEATTGKTGKLIENCLINLYRKTYTESEVDELIRFYKTPAGKKMDKEFILLIMQSMKDAEQLLKMAAMEIK